VFGHRTFCLLHALLYMKRKEKVAVVTFSGVRVH